MASPPVSCGAFPCQSRRGAQPVQSRVESCTTMLRPRDANHRACRRPGHPQRLGRRWESVGGHPGFRPRRPSPPALGIPGEASPCWWHRLAQDAPRCRGRPSCCRVVCDVPRIAASLCKWESWAHWAEEAAGCSGLPPLGLSPCSERGICCVDFRLRRLGMAPRRSQAAAWVPVEARVVAMPVEQHRQKTRLQSHAVRGARLNSAAR